MIWPFTRRNVPTPRHIAGTHQGTDEPTSFPVNNPSHSEVIGEFLEAARRRGATLKRGESFKLTFPEEHRRQFSHYIELVGPVMIRAADYQLQSGATIDWTFEFIWLGTAGTADHETDDN